jgi:hypothetical protein
MPDLPPHPGANRLAVLSAVEFNKALVLSPALAGTATDYGTYRALAQAAAEEMAAPGQTLSLAFPCTEVMVARSPEADPFSAAALKGWLAGLGEDDLVPFLGSLDAAELEHRLSVALRRSFELLGIDMAPGVRYAKKLVQLVRGAAERVVGERGNLWVMAVEEPGTAGVLKVSLELRRLGGDLVLPSPAADRLLLNSCALALANDGFFFVAAHGYEVARCCGWHITMDQTFAVSADDARGHFDAFGMASDMAGWAVSFFEPTVDDLYG